MLLSARANLFRTAAGQEPSDGEILFYGRTMGVHRFLFRGLTT
jgi:hypothetical protein